MRTDLAKVPLSPEALYWLIEARKQKPITAEGLFQYSPITTIYYLDDGRVITVNHSDWSA
jgi:hypothetical protein